MYLKVQYNNSIKQYSLTDSYNKPYIKVSNSILPLTTNTTNGIHLILSTNNTTYRPLEYNSMSTSDTYYTSGIQSNGLSSTTALTRSSTYDTQYYTRSSTSSTVYYTRSSTSGTNYLTKTVADNKINACGTYYLWYYRYTYDGENLYSRSECRFSGTNCQISSSYRSNAGTVNNIPWQGLSLTLYVSSSAFYTRIRTSDNYSITWTNSSFYGSKTLYLSMPQDAYTSYGSTTGHLTSFNTSNYFFANKESYRSATISASTGNTISVWVNIITQTTGTQYLTRSSTSAISYLTRSSTYSTIYLTRSSTSGYSGVSSSSSQSSGWL